MARTVDQNQGHGCLCPSQAALLPSKGGERCACKPSFFGVAWDKEVIGRA
jgi:hypothetical protein